MSGPRTTNLGYVCFGWKWFQEIIFTQARMFGCNGKFYFPEIHFQLTKIYSFDPELILHFYFRFKSFPEKERVRERERERRESPDRREKERKKREPARSSDERSSDEREETKRRSTSGAIVWRARSSDDRAPRQSRLRARSSIGERARRSASALVDRRAARSSDERARRSRRESDDRTDLASHLVKGRAISSSPPLHRSSPPISPAPIWWIFLLGFAFSVNDCEIINYLHVYGWGIVWKIGHVKHFL